MVSAKRKSDAVIAVRQNNTGHKIEIQDVNRAAEQLTGRAKTDLIGRHFSDILPDRYQDMIDSYVEYDTNTNDLDHVLKRVIEFKVRNKIGEEVPVEMKVFRIPGRDLDPCFEILMRDITLQEKMKEIKQRLQQEVSAQQITDTDTGLPSIAALLQYIDIVAEFITTHKVEAAFGIIDIEPFYPIQENYGPAAANRLMKEIGDRFKRTVRAEDSLGYFGDGMLGVLLFDCNNENAMVALRRIRASFTNKPIEILPGQSENITVNISFRQIIAGEDVGTLVQDCAAVLDRAAEEGGNKITQVLG